MAIWIAVVDELSICRYNLGNHNCKIDSEFVFIFINNPSIVTYVHFLSNECDDPDKIRTELKSFRKESQLSFCSMAFMHVPYIRLKKLYDLDVLLFREIFPHVNLLPIYGTTSSYGSCFCDFKKPLLWPVREDRGNKTSILIISRK
ncbi:hypothetical protein M0802_015899 [Mischocyttarus mexicanus]|nr:hypothetical protein M0802_015899 [Mischocyttarus mexicanus]